MLLALRQREQGPDFRCPQAIGKSGPLTVALLDRPHVVGGK
jgi:hypothetical protein